MVLVFLKSRFYVSGAGHNDIELRSEYIDRLRQFFNVELP